LGKKDETNNKGKINDGIGLNKPSAALERALHSELLASVWLQTKQSMIYPFVFTQRDMCPTCNVFSPNTLLQLSFKFHILSVIEANDPNAGDVIRNSDPSSSSSSSSSSSFPSSQNSLTFSTVTTFLPWYTPFISENGFSSDYAIDSKNGTIQLKGDVYELQYTLEKEPFYKTITRVRIGPQPQLELNSPSSSNSSPSSSSSSSSSFLSSSSAPPVISQISPIPQITTGSQDNEDNPVDPKDKGSDENKKKK
jgi:hypothetical protein